MAGKDIIVVGASAGGIEALCAIAAGLPRELPAAVFVVQHSAADAPGVLPQILDKAGDLSASHARDGGRFEHGHLYVAPPDHHLLLAPDDTIRVTRGPKENGFRPAVDPLFRSAARTYGARVVGVVLTGGLDDGTMGLLAIKQRGGMAVVQDPYDAMVPSMPLSAVSHVKVDYVVPLVEVAPLLRRLVGEPAEEESYPVDDELDIEVKIALEDNAVEAGVMGLGDPSNFACPDCHGVLLRLKGEGPMRFRCHTGHAYTADSLVSGINQNVEGALWNTIRALEEAEILLRHMAEHLGEGRQREPAEALLDHAVELRRRADLVRQATFTRTPVAG